MEYTKYINGEDCKIKIQGKFTFADHIEFKKIFEFFENIELRNMEIDMRGVEFIDSAALGLLLLVRDTAEKKSVRLTLIEPSGQVQKMFKISRFYELFNITKP